MLLSFINWFSITYFYRLWCRYNWCSWFCYFFWVLWCCRFCCFFLSWLGWWSWWCQWCCFCCFCYWSFTSWWCSRCNCCRWSFWFLFLLSSFTWCHTLYYLFDWSWFGFRSYLVHYLLSKFISYMFCCRLRAISSNWFGWWFILSSISCFLSSFTKAF